MDWVLIIVTTIITVASTVLHGVDTVPGTARLNLPA